MANDDYRAAAIASVNPGVNNELSLLRFLGDYTFSD